MCLSRTLLCTTELPVLCSPSHYTFLYCILPFMSCILLLDYYILKLQIFLSFIRLLVHIILPLQISSFVFRVHLLLLEQTFILKHFKTYFSYPSSCPPILHFSSFFPLLHRWAVNSLNCQLFT